MAELQDIAAKLLEQETSPEIMKLKEQILRRIALESDVKPSRIPAPLNITQIGGYINLLRKLNKEENDRQLEIIRLLKQNSDDVVKDKTAYQTMLEQMLTSVLGLPVQTPTE